jgi:hypothetical protein
MDKSVDKPEEEGKEHDYGEANAVTDVVADAVPVAPAQTRVPVVPSRSQKGVLNTKYA